MTAGEALRLSQALAGRYRIERELGQGGMATVYLAHDLRHQRRVALKVLRPDLAAVIGAERFLHEITTTANLQHPHILPLHDSGSLDGTAFYVMPYVEGESLRDRLNREKQLPLADALRIATEVAGALDYAHRHGVIHRDIKPENILLHDGRALVADFGIALAASSAGGSRMTETGMSLGTPSYMSPEQAMGERALDARTDVYALGSVLYEMLTGEPPFAGPTAQAIVAKVMTAEPVPPAELRRTVPEHVNDAVLTALQKLPADRFATAAELASALAGETAVRRTGTRALPGRAARRPAPWLTALLGATTVAALAWGGWQATRERPIPPAPVVRFTIPGALAGAFAGNLLAISPDGTRLVLVQQSPGSDRTRLAVRRLESLETVPLAGTEGALAPFFSPDGEWIAFRDGTRLRKTRVDGGGAITIAEVGQAGNYQADWGPGDLIAYTARGGRIHLVPAAGGTPGEVTTDSAYYRDPSWLPDGEHLLAARSRTYEESDVVVISARDGRVVATLAPGVSPRYVKPGYLTWLSREGTLLAAPFDPSSLRLLGQPVTVAEGFSYMARTVSFAVAANGTLAWGGSGWSDKELVLVSPGGEARALPLGKRAFRGPRFSPDGSRIAVDVEPGGDLVGDIWLYDIAPQTFTRLTFEGTSVFPEWTPDGREVLYSAETPEGRGIYRVPADRSRSPELLVSSRSNVYEGLLAGDGRLLYRENSDSTGRDILILEPDGSVTRFAAGPFQERAAALSRDGRLVAYSSDETGQHQVYVKPLAGGGAVQVSSAGGIEPRFGPGDREIYFRWQDTLFAAPVFREPLRVGARRVVLVGDYVAEPYHANWDISPDGRSFVFIRQPGGSRLADVTVVLNWFQNVARRGRP
jgi:Tol biopolymer transport system component/tRNA A-37 threonylcarbamoyl transferase component Bud32